MLIAGKACLILALATCLYGIAASLYGARRGRREWVASGRRAVYAVAGTTGLAFAILQAAFLRSDFSFCARRLALLHDDARVLQGDGRLVLAGGLAAAVAAAPQPLVELDPVPDAQAAARARALRDRRPAAASARSSPRCWCSSRRRSARPCPPRREGVGLNPLLRHPSMMIHPPMLYSGYTLFAIPFAFAVGALSRGG